MAFEPNYQHLLDAACNRRPQRIPLYEHIISPEIMEKVLGEEFAQYELSNDENELRHFFKHYCAFFKKMTYDTVSFEFPIIYCLPAQGESIIGRQPGPIQSRKDFEAIDWDEIVQKYISNADIKFRILGEYLPEGMKAIGGVANGVFEISEDLVGLEYLAYMQIDDPQLFRDVYQKIGELMHTVWQWFLEKHGHLYAVCRFGDDLGFKSGTLTSPAVIREHIIPQYKQVIGLIRQSGHAFLWHSCGCIFEIMEDVIALGINAKHSNEDSIAPFDKWIELYSDRIGLFGGIDVDVLCQKSPEEIEMTVYEHGKRFRANANGFALGSGNSIPNYIPVEGYLAMIDGVKKIRQDEQAQ